MKRTSFILGTRRFPRGLAALVRSPHAVPVGALLLALCLAPCLGRGQVPALIGPDGADVERRWTDIEHKTDAVAHSLSPAGLQAMQASRSRFYQWVDAYCDKAEALEDPSGGNLRCVEQEYSHYLDHAPKSVYSVGPWTVYETVAYGLLWGGIDLLDQDPHRPPGELQIAVPHVDAVPTPLSLNLDVALRDRIHSLVSGWAVDGWQQSLSVRIDSINACYASLGIEQFVYTGGAHPNGNFESFNWNRMSNAPLNLADLFKPGIDWRHAVVTLYQKHVRAGDGGVRRTIFEDQPFLTEDALQRSIDRETVVTDQGLKIVVGGLAPAYGLILPAILLKWGEIQPWLVPSAPCTGGGKTTNVTRKSEHMADAGAAR